MKTFQLHNNCDGFSQKPLRIAIGAIFKNESPYIIEWLAYHRVIGVNQFYIADNRSNDGTTELLSVLHSLGMLVHIPFPHVDGQPPQMAAYGEIMRRHRHEADWFAFIDADEFLVSDGGGETLLSMIKRLHSDESVGSVALNWATFGSSSHLYASDGLVLERFNKRGDRSWGVNNHYKSIVRSEAFVGEHKNPHLFILKEGFKSVHADGSALKDSQSGIGISERVVWSPFRINHYVVKSREEFVNRKRLRGRATLSNVMRSEAFFESHDRNEIEDISIDKEVIASVKVSIEEIKLEIAARVEGIVAVAKSVANEGYDENQSTQSLKHVRGAIDDLRVEGWNLVVRGWAIDDDGRPLPNIVPVVNGRSIHSATLSRTPRPDVVRLVSGAAEEAGFTLRFPLLDLPKNSGPGSKLILVGGGSAGSYAYRIGSSYRLIPEILTAPNSIERGTVSPRVSRGVNFFKEIKVLGLRNPIQTVMDVGANTGQTVREIKEEFPSAEVYSFEPVDKTFQSLRKNVDRYGGVHCYRIALSDVDRSTAVMEIGVSSVDSQIVEFAGRGENEWVETRTGDSVVGELGLQTIDILKIDTEGHDLRVIEGFRGCLTAGTVRFIIIECGMNVENTKHKQFVEISEALGTHGYKLFGLYEQVRELNSGIPLRRANAAFVSPRVCDDK